MKKNGFQPGHAKTGGRQKGSGGRPLWLTVPPDLKHALPADNAEAREMVIAALRAWLADKN